MKLVIYKEILIINIQDKDIIYQEIKDYNVLIDGRNFYDQNGNSSIVRYNELLQMTTGRPEDYSTGCLLLDYDYYIKDFNIVGIDLSHQAVLDSDPKINQQIEFIYKLPNAAHGVFNLLTVVEKEKQKVLKFSEGTVKVY